MPSGDEKFRADAARYYLTGAGSDGGAQTDPDAALGGFRSSTACQFLAASIADAISNVTVDFVAGANGTGAGTLNAPSANTLTWTPPGGTVGPAITIANGETKVLEGGGSGEASKYIRVSRSSADDLTGTATLTLSYSVNNVTGMDDVSSAEAAAGDTEYRCLCLRNEHPTNAMPNIAMYNATLGTQQVSDTADLDASGAGTISTSGSFSTWPESGFCHIKNAGTTREVVYYTSRTDTVLTVPSAGRGLLGTTAAAGAATDTLDAVSGQEIALESPTSGTATTGSVQTIADEDTAPSSPSLTFTNAITATNAATHASLGVGEILFVWIKRTIVVGHESAYNPLQMPIVSFDSV